MGGILIKIRYWCFANGGFWGAKSLEQRSFAVTPAEKNQHSVIKDEKGGLPMKGTNNTDAPQLNVNWKHSTLAILHLIVFVLSVLNGEFITERVTARALPQTLFGF